MIKIGFITGARSEYGIMKPLIRSMANDSRFDVEIIATGMHFLSRYGHTIEEIYKDGLVPIIEAPCYKEESTSKKEDFIFLIDVLFNVLSDKGYDVVYLIGDRLEAYAAALAAHFLHIPIAHYAGGQITEGAVDNIYRYNISNLAAWHFATNKYAVERLNCCPVVNSNRVYLVGSSAIDAIYDYLKTPQDATEIDKRLTRNNYVLITFHSETKSMENGGDSISEMLDAALQYLTSHNEYALLTYPNNDDGAMEIIKVIENWENNPLVVVRRNLGSQLYYVAVDNSKYVLGNSSSAIIEVPYFGKYSIDVGNRQKGRNAPQSVIHVSNNTAKLIEQMDRLQRNYVCTIPQEFIYGKGDSVNMIKQVFNSGNSHG